MWQAANELQQRVGAACPERVRAPSEADVARELARFAQIKQAGEQEWRRMGTCSGAQAPRYIKGRLLASASLQAAASKPTRVGIVLEAGKPYFIVGKGTVSLWDGQSDGCDSVFRYRTPLEPNGGALVVWGQLKLVNPTVHLSDLIRQQTGTAPVYQASHVYEALLTGTGLPLEAVVHDGGGYSDNHGQLTVEVYEAVVQR